MTENNCLNEVYTFAEATALLGKSVSYLNWCVSTGKLLEGDDYRTAGRVKLIRKDVVDRLINEHNK